MSDIEQEPQSVLKLGGYMYQGKQIKFHFNTLAMYARCMKVPFNMSEAQFALAIPERCPTCQETWDFERFPRVERVDAAKPMQVDNITFICAACENAKKPGHKRGGTLKSRYRGSLRATGLGVAAYVADFAPACGAGAPGPSRAHPAPRPSLLFSNLGG